MTALERVEQARGALKVFPLPSAVLLPHGLLPLHIFEPRYRDLVRDALATDQVMALGGLLPGWEEDYGGRPPLAPLLCAAVIAWHEALPDGRYNVLLRGVCRARVVHELAARHAYREVQVQLQPDAPYAGPEEEQLRQAVLELGARLPPELAQQLLPACAHASGGQLADVVASAVVPDVDRRLELLAEPDPRARLTEVLADVGDVIARLVPQRATGPLN